LNETHDILSAPLKLERAQSLQKEIEKLLVFQNKAGVKCFHNEMRVLYEILSKGPLPSLDIMRMTGRSISAHNDDIKRLTMLGLIESRICQIDKRRKLYDLTDKARELLEI
jgi:DNA-binding MarR family transcriptional regulator